jgi:two-component system, OmpR family, phosphate regulon sensor histidine kinase PhoR
MVLRSKTIRFAILTSIVLVTIIIGIQLFWLQKVYRYEEKQFNINVSKTIRSIYADMELVNDVSDNVQKVIENPKPDLYLVRIDCTPNLDDLWETMKAELTDFDVYTDCKAGIYSHEKNNYVAEKYVDLPDAYHSGARDIALPEYKRDYSYIAMFFPHRGQYILKQMFFWIASSILLLLVLTGLGACIFYLYRQKFLNETQKDFVNNFTHEFKTPLAVIRIAADVIKQRDIVEKPDKLENYANIIAEQTAHLQGQIQRLLEIAYTDRTSLPLKKENADLNQLVQEAINNLQPLIEQKNVLLNIEPAPHPFVVKADKAYLSLAFVNLIENAIKYVHQQPEINIRLEAEENDYSISFTDNGIGIEPSQHKKIFDRFYRVPTGELHTAKGFGLGLNFVKKVIDAHNGRIEVVSKPGSGSTFIIKIPRR